MVLRGSSNMVGRRSEDVVGRGLVYAVDPVGWLVGRRSESALEGLERGSSDVFRRGSVGMVLRGSSNMVGRRSEDVVGRGLVYAVDPVGWLVGRRSESALEGLERGSSDVFRRG
jgi:hypothetical protein